MKEFLSTFETFASYLKLDYGEFQRGDANLTSETKRLFRIVSSPLSDPLLSLTKLNKSIMLL